MEALGLPDTICSGVDVTDYAAVQAAVDAAVAVHGPVDCFVNNAGCMLLSSFVDQDPKEWERMIGVNVFGVLNGMKTCAKAMIERGTGTLINVSSIAGIKTFPSHAVYCATKAAVHFMTEGVREECSESGVRVVCIAPGVVETELLSHTTDEAVKSGYHAWKAGELKGKPLLPEDVANAVAYAYAQPPHVCIREIVLAPTFQKA